MNKALMISIRPEHAVNILNGKKTLELRPFIPKGYVGWVYAYVTKGKPYLVYQDGYRGGRYFEHEWQFLYGYSYENTLKIFGHGMTGGIVNGLVVFRFWFDDYIAYKHYEDNNTYFAKRPQDFGYNADEVLKRLCLSRDEFKAYGKGKDLYAWHIKKLEVFDEPKQLSEFYKKRNSIHVFSEEEYSKGMGLVKILKAPQKMAWVYVNE